jgi:hypothetical protein
MHRLTRHSRLPSASKAIHPPIRLTLRNSPEEIKRVLAELKVTFESRTDFKSFHAHVLTTFRTAVEV